MLLKNPVRPPGIVYVLYLFYSVILFYSMKLCLNLMQERVFILRVRTK